MWPAGSREPLGGGTASYLSVVLEPRGEDKMKKSTLTIATGLALLTGWLLVPGLATAQALKTPIEGAQVACNNFREPDREWVDEDGVTHVRGQRRRCNYDDGDLIGREFILSNWDEDLAAGTLFGHSTNFFEGTILGQDAPATGHFTDECTRSEGVWTCVEEHVWHLEDGRLLKLSATYVAYIGFPIPYAGILLDPPGRTVRPMGRRR